MCDPDLRKLTLKVLLLYMYLSMNDQTMLAMIPNRIQIGLTHGTNKGFKLRKQKC